VLLHAKRAEAGEAFAIVEPTIKISSEAQFLKLSGELAKTLVLHGTGLSSILLLLGIEPLAGLVNALGLNLADNLSLGPASSGSEISKGAELSERLESEHLEGFRNDNALLVSIGEWHTLIDLKAAESGGTLRGLVGEHTSDHLPEHAGGGFPVLEVAARVGVVAAVTNLLNFEVVAEKRTRNVDSFATNDNASLSIEQLFGDNASETAHHMTASINNNLLFEHA